MNSHKVFIHVHQGCFAGTGAIVRLPQCQWSKPDGYGKISQCITTIKHSKAKTECTFLGIYCNTCHILSKHYPVSLSSHAMIICSLVSISHGQFINLLSIYLSSFRKVLVTKMDTIPNCKNELSESESEIVYSLVIHGIHLVIFSHTHTKIICLKTCT